MEASVIFLFGLVVGGLLGILLGVFTMRWVQTARAAHSASQAALITSQQKTIESGRSYIEVLEHAHADDRGLNEHLMVIWKAAGDFIDNRLDKDSLETIVRNVTKTIAAENKVAESSSVGGILPANDSAPVA